MSRTITHEEVEWFGAAQTRFLEIDIDNYDDDAGGDGESLTPAQVGMSRFQRVIVEVDPGGDTEAGTQVNAVAQYDYDADAIRLYYGGTDGGELSEVTSDANEGGVVRATVIGR